MHTLQCALPGGLTGTGSSDSRIIAAMRLVLAASGLLILGLHSDQAMLQLAPSIILLGSYTLYSAALYLYICQQQQVPALVLQWAHWLDVAWYTLLIALSGGSTSSFFFGYFFAILLASFRWGFQTGLRVTLISTALYSAVSLVTALNGLPLDVTRAVLRPIYLVVLGFLIAHWGGYELRLRQRLQLLRDVSRLSNPRFGVERTVSSLPEQLRAFYQADSCLLISHDPYSGELQLQRASGDLEQHARAETLPQELARRLLDVPAEQVAIFRGQGQRWLLLQPGYQTYDPWTGAPELASAEQARALAAMLDARSFITVPFQQQESSGRLYLAAARPAAFDAHDAELLLQVIAQVTPVLRNIRLVVRLMYGATRRPFMRRWSLRVGAASWASAFATPTRLPRRCRASRRARSVSAPAPWADVLLSSTTIDTPPLSSKFRYSARRALR